MTTKTTRIRAMNVTVDSMPHKGKIFIGRYSGYEELAQAHYQEFFNHDVALIPDDNFWSYINWHTLGHDIAESSDWVVEDLRPKARGIDVYEITGEKDD